MKLKSIFNISFYSCFDTAMHLLIKIKEIVAINLKDSSKVKASSAYSLSSKGRCVPQNKDPGVRPILHNLFFCSIKKWHCDQFTDVQIITIMKCMVSNNTDCCDSSVIVMMVCTNITYRTSNILHIVVVRHRSS